MKICFSGDMGALLDHLDTYHAVRGWRARRVYLTLKERMTLLLDERAVRVCSSTAGTSFMCDGAVVLPVLNQAVADRIREWDLQT